MPKKIMGKNPKNKKVPNKRGKSPSNTRKSKRFRQSSSPPSLNELAADSEFEQDAQNTASPTRGRRTGHSSSSRRGLASVGRESPAIHAAQVHASDRGESSDKDRDRDTDGNEGDLDDPSSFADEMGYSMMELLFQYMLLKMIYLMNQKIADQKWGKPLRRPGTMTGGTVRK